MMIISVGLKKEGLTTNTYEFEFWVEGVETEWYEKINEWLKSHDNMYYFFLACLGCCGIMVLCCIAACIKNCCDSRNNKTFDKI